ncbi:MAG: branched-chain amino acid ABC transporter permease [Burkholderiales bacterium]|nr:branched-chain amino acid ABC transporter permease [Burkholderiales bacterium]
MKRVAILLFAAAVLVSLPWWAGDQYQLHLAALIGAYWVLIAGLNLVVGFSGQLSVGHVGLLAIGAYAYAILAGTHEWNVWLALAASGGIGALCGLLLGLPSLRLPGFYFAMATLAFALIVTELVLALDGLTGGGVGLSVPEFPAPFDTAAGSYWLILGIAVIVTWLTWNVARLMWGRGLIAVRDSMVTAQAVGVPVFHAKLVAFVFSGLTAGLGGALFAVMQSYITPDTFLFELGLFFFVCIIIGGRGSILGPFLGTVVLTALPELSAPLAKLGNFFYGLLLLLVVLLLPEGIGRLFQIGLERLRPQRLGSMPIEPQPAQLALAIKAGQR